MRITCIRLAVISFLGYRSVAVRIQLLARVLLPPLCHAGVSRDAPTFRHRRSSQSQCWQFESIPFLSALSRAQQAVKFSCALASRRSSASPARPSGLPVPSQKASFAEISSFSASPKKCRPSPGEQVLPASKCPARAGQKKEI